MISFIKSIYLDLIILNTNLVAFIFNYSSKSYDQVIALSVLLLPFEILYLFSIIIGIMKYKNKKIKIFNFIVLVIILFILVFNRIK